MNENRMDIEARPIIQFDKVNKWFENLGERRYRFKISVAT